MVDREKQLGDADKLAAIYNQSSGAYGTHGTMLGVLKQCFCCSLHTGAIITGIYAMVSSQESSKNPQRILKESSKNPLSIHRILYESG